MPTLSQFEKRPTTNIAHLAVPEINEGFAHFRPEMLIEPWVVEDLLKFIDEANRIDHSVEALSVADPLVTLFPELRSAVHIDEDDIRREFYRYYKVIAQQPGGLSLTWLRQVGRARTLFPHRVDEIFDSYPDLLPEQENKIRSDYDQGYYQAAHFRLLHLTKAYGQQVPMIREEWLKISLLNQYLKLKKQKEEKIFYDKITAADADQYGQSVFVTRLYAPITSEFVLSASQLKRTLRAIEVEKPSSNVLLDQALALSLIFAQEVKITHEGVSIRLPENVKKEQNTENVPVQRSF